MRSQATGDGRQATAGPKVPPIGDAQPFDELRLPLLRDFVVAMVDVDRVSDDVAEFHVEELAFDLPIELEYDDADLSPARPPVDASTRLGVSPPTQIVSTTVMPVFHRLRVTLAEGEE